MTKQISIPTHMIFDPELMGVFRNMIPLPYDRGDEEYEDDEEFEDEEDFDEGD